MCLRNDHSNIVKRYNNYLLQFAEVKGPNDRLSTKQILWIDRITNWGIDVDVCHVKGNIV